MMETETPQPAAAPPPSRYRTIRRKLANNAQPPPAAAPAVKIPTIEPRKPAVRSSPPEQPLARQPSKFRQILRLNTHPKESTAPAAIPQFPATVPHYNKLSKSHSPPKKVYTKRDEVIDKTLEKLTGSSSLEKLSPYDEPVSTLSNDGT